MPISENQNSVNKAESENTFYTVKVGSHVSHRWGQMMKDKALWAMRRIQYMGEVWGVAEVGDTEIGPVLDAVLGSSKQPISLSHSSKNLHSRPDLEEFF